MKHSSSAAPPLHGAPWFANPQRWSLAVIVMAFLSCVVISWLHFQQQQILMNTSTALDTHRQARVDLAQGFLHLSLADATASPFDREQGLALLDQAIATFVMMTTQVEGAPRRVTAFHADVEDFRVRLLAWRSLSIPTPAQETALRIAYGQLERQTQVLDALIRTQLHDLTNRLYRIYLWTLGSAGVLLGVVCVAYYVSVQARRTIEDELRAEKERFQRIVDTAPGVVHARRETSDGKLSFPYASPRIEEIYGVSAAQLAIDAAVVRQLIHPDDRALVQHTVAVSAQTLQSWRAEYRLCHPHRGEIWIEGHSIPHREADGSIVWYGVLTEITERKQAEAALHRALRDQAQTLAQLDALFSSAPIGIGLWDRQLRFLRLNQTLADINGLPLDAHLGKHIREVIPEVAGIDELVGIWEEVITTGKPKLNIELTGFTRQLPLVKRSWIDNFFPVRVGEEIIGIAATVLDISDRKAAEQEIQRLNSELEARVIERTAQLQVANQELEAFTYSVSHDLRAPLRAMDGYTRILLEEYAPQLDEEALRVCDIICAESKRMGRLIDDLLRFSRWNRAEVQMTALDMTELVQTVFAQIVTDERRPAISFHLHALPPAWGDIAMLRQVWENLLANSIKFSAQREQVVIEVGSGQTPTENIYWVRDNGAGFNMHYVDKLFSVFQRLHSERAFPGTGVGLAIVQRVIQRHGGRVWAQSEVEQGATFYFTLPTCGPNCGSNCRTENG